ncbi:MAG: DNA polymerase III subunit delta [Thermogemmatispora sp.]|jgi:DNA polymerase-3 subunit delta|uniref:DNA-directed DNA polymerase n=1 Tax=Thermogemmatispora aurantia TaxID=2045279 RepID=A0A5J4KAU5_9CHLR|nr:MULTISPECIES: DNA polymerase III subunit delta [Thermogemmatispora]MBE3565660.1 DNA polymerase III subunit delta [Thermogemmatispora sp.]GER85694.1 DNA polymerase III subunit delta [Thermogemmatispora aurantia]
MFYLLHGDDEFSSREALRSLRQQGDFGYNQDTYHGDETELATIVATCSTLPFLSEGRLVIVEGLPRKRRGGSSTAQEREAASPSTESDQGTASAAGEGAEERKRSRTRKGSKKAGGTSRADFEQGLASFVPVMPASTTLILLVDEALEARHPLVEAARRYGQEIKSMLPKGAALERWIEERAARLKVRITREAVTLLANFIGSQTRMLANELEKLATYVGEGGTIDVPHVRALSAQVQETRIFDLTDALAQRRQQQALDILHSLLSEGQPPLLLLGFMLSQVRTLLLVKELTQKGLRAAEIASTLGIAPFIAERAAQQVRQFSLAQLEFIYRQLAETDAALKRSRLSPEVAFDLLLMHFFTTSARP